MVDAERGLTVTRSPRGIGEHELADHARTFQLRHRCVSAGLRASARITLDEQQATTVGELFAVPEASTVHGRFVVPRPRPQRVWLSEAKRADVGEQPHENVEGKQAPL